jgi:hypothetical protein
VEAQGRLMPGGENAIIVPHLPDRDRQEEILIEHITDWFGSKRLQERGGFSVPGGTRQ